MYKRQDEDEEEDYNEVQEEYDTDSIEAVSYTHLDVYKRQDCGGD